MSDNVIQASLNSGEWSPKLFARVDLQKYKSGAALLENFFVDYRGGASTRPGTKYILQCLKSATAVRLIPFQASFSVGYVLEFGEQYIRFFFDGAPVLEAAKTITSVVVGFPSVFTSAAHGYFNNQWIFAGNKYYIIQNATVNTFTLTDLFGNDITNNPFVLPTAARRLYTIATNYLGSELAQLKFAQNVGELIICHANHVPRVLTLIAPTNWTLVNINFGSTANTPGGLGYVTSLAAGSTFYSYIVTGVDTNGQESVSSGPLGIGPLQDLRTTLGTITVTWLAAVGAVSYNIYKSNVNYGGVVPPGQIHGYIGSSNSLSFVDDNISPDFSSTPPINRSPLALGNPTVPGFFQQRLVLASPAAGPQTFFMSQPGHYYNFNISTFSQADDAITGTIASGQLSTIRSMVSQPSGLLMFTDRSSWLINGGSQGSAVTPSAIVANAQSFNGVSDVPPITANFDVLYVQAKGSFVRDSAYNIYSNVYTGTDISALASHLFYGYTITEWAWAEEPFKLAWAVRSDGVLLTLTFLKEQEFIGWTHSTTLGSFKSVATVIETTPTAGDVDSVYFVVERTVAGQTLKYIERLAERTFPNGVEDAWCIDCGISYSGVPETNFTGAEFLGGLTVTGLADGVVIPPFVMPFDGNFSIATPASKLTVGIGYTAKLQTLPLDMGDPTIQGKVKKINGVTVRVAEALGLSIGGEAANAVPMKDLIVGNVSSMLVGQNTQVVTNLVDGDARTFIEPRFTVPGQYYIEQSLPLPATILGLISDYTVGDVGARR